MAEGIAPVSSSLAASVRCSAGSGQARTAVVSTVLTALRLPRGVRLAVPPVGVLDVRRERCAQLGAVRSAEIYLVVRAVDAEANRAFRAAAIDVINERV
jgi:hypothetical protein